MSFIKKSHITLPLILFILIIIFLWKGLNLHPNLIPSPLINKPAPYFELPSLLDSKKISNKDFIGHVTLLNVWATWCATCAEEHDLLLQLAQQEHIIIYGLNYKDNPNAAKKWLMQYGNPYQKIAVDQLGNVAIDLGVYGTPETFIIDKKGVIRYKHIGAISADVWENKLRDLVTQLQNESS